MRNPFVPLLLLSAASLITPLISQFLSGNGVGGNSRPFSLANLRATSARKKELELERASQAVFREKFDEIKKELREARLSLTDASEGVIAAAREWNPRLLRLIAQDRSELPLKTATAIILVEHIIEDRSESTERIDCLLKELKQFEGVDAGLIEELQSDQPPALLRPRERPQV